MGPTPDLAATARQVIDASQYLVLATADQHGVPWASPVWYAHASYREFFWASRPQARHSRNIEARPQVSIVIFDSSVRPGAARAVYISGTAELTTGPELRRSIEIYSRRSREHGLAEWTVDDVQAPADHRLYRAVAAEQSVLMPGGVDLRIPINTDDPPPWTTNLRLDRQVHNGIPLPRGTYREGAGYQGAHHQGRSGVPAQ